MSNKLLILSIEKDLLTSNVIEWLIFYDKEFIRINVEDNVEVEIELSNNEINVSINNGINHNLRSFNQYWYRRGNFNIENHLLSVPSKIGQSINQHKIINAESIKSYLHKYIECKFNSINGYNDNEIDKLTELSEAKSLGISIPETIITSSRKTALEFVNKHKIVITKTIKSSLNMQIDKYDFYWHTLLVSKEDIESFPESFSLIKLQKYIDKILEIRTFYLDGIFYSSAIFSQNDEQTKIDFRNYNESRPNRVLPFQLPKWLEIKLKRMMNKLKLKSGSLDIILSKKNEFIFLEVNPIGQFSQVSFPCNYYLEEKMAKSLLN